MLIDFNTTTEINESHLRNDKIEITIKGIYFNGSYSSFNSFVETLASRPPEDFPKDRNDQYNRGWIFNRPRGNLAYSPTMTVRGGKTIGVPLFGGKLQYAGINDPESNDFSKELIFYMSFNPMRMFANSSITKDSNGNLLWTNSEIPVRRPRIVSYRNHSNDDSSDKKNEIILDNNDNVLSRSQWSEFCNRDNWINFLESALQSVVDAYKDELYRAIEESDEIDTGSLDETNIDYSLTSLETCVEVDVGNNLTSVDVLKKWQNPLSWYLSTSVKEYRINPKLESHYMAPSLTMNYGKGKQLRLYAKTDKRIRIEYIQNNEGLGRTKRTSKTISGITKLILEKSNNSIVKFNSLLSWTHEATQNLTTHEPYPHRFILEIAKHCTDMECADIIVSSLIQNGSVKACDDMRITESIENLKRANILQKPVGTTRKDAMSYTASKPFLASLNFLMRAKEPDWKHIPHITG